MIENGALTDLHSFQADSHGQDPRHGKHCLPPSASFVLILTWLRQIQEQDDGVKFNVWTQAKSYDYTPGGQLIIGGQKEGDATGSSSQTVVNNRKRAVGGSLAARAQDAMSS